jgi:hypothetical protein
MDGKMKQAVRSLRARLTPHFVEDQVREPLRQGEDVGGGVNAFRLIRHLLGGASGNDEQVAWAYAQLKPALADALDQILSLYYFEGD